MKICLGAPAEGPPIFRRTMNLKYHARMFKGRMGGASSATFTKKSARMTRLGGNSAQNDKSDARHRGRRRIADRGERI
jgi:hypothetical protein